MIKNYFRIAFRKIAKHKAYAMINISGLAIGIGACLLLFTVVKYELSYDRFQPNFKSIFRVVAKDEYPDGIDYTAGIPFPALSALRAAFPNYETGALFARNGSQVTVPGDNPAASKKFIEGNGFIFCDLQLLQVFKFNWLAGAPSILDKPNTTVLTKTMAEKYFGDWQQAVGKSLVFDNAITVKVEGIIEDVPVNTDFALSIITSFETVKANAKLYGYSTDWGSVTSNFQIFMLLPPNVLTDRVNSQLVQFSRSHYESDKNSKRTHLLQPLSEVHFDSRFSSFGEHIISKSTLWTLSLVGVFIIIMACINFINLSTAQAVGRSKEVGIRKVLGSTRLRLLGQVMGETGVIVGIAVVIAMLMAALALPYIKHIDSIEEPLTLFTLQTLLFLVVLIFAVTLFAGIYPALILSGFKPVLALKNKITSATVGGISIRRGLVVTQFAISQVLIIGTIVAVTQMDYIQKADLGFDKNALLLINANTDSVVYAKQDVFKQRLLQIPGVQSVSFSSDVPSSNNNWSGNFAFDHKPDETFSVFRKAADEDYVKTYGLHFVAGKIYEKSDTAREVVINETLSRKLGVSNTADIIGKDIRVGRNTWKKIVGVVKDFNNNSLKEDIKPLMIFERRERYSVTGVKIASLHINETQAAVESAWNEFYPQYAYTTSYMDKNIAEFYKQEEQLSLLYKIFAGIAIFISCLGLYGLVSFMAVQKTKEIGIRKLLGASVQSIIYLFSKEFIFLIIIGFLVAAPVAYLTMNSWLKNFVFKISISPVIFIIAIVSSLLIASLTVGYKSVRAAVRNPVDSLKSE